MSDTPTDAAPDQVEAPAQESKPEVDWKAKAREWEQRAKSNKAAADRLAELEEANKTEAQKVAERLAEAEAKAQAAEQRALRFEIATEFGLTGEGAKALEHIASEDGMRAVAQLLAGKAEQERKQGNVVPREGTGTGSAAADERSAFAAYLTGNPT